MDSLYSLSCASSAAILPFSSMLPAPAFLMPSSASRIWLRMSASLDFMLSRDAFADDSFAPTSSNLVCDAAPNFNVVFGLMLPPVIAPDASSNSPDFVTILTPPMRRLPVFMLSTTIVSAKTYQNTERYSGLKSIRSIAYPNESLTDIMAFARGFPSVILFKGRSVALPWPPLFSSEMISAAT